MNEIGEFRSLAKRGLATIDIEASSLTETGYPIEIACVLGDQSGIHLQFSTLIRPRSAWRSDRYWCDRSARVHGIGRASLAGGMEADRVCEMLDMLLGSSIVTVNGGSFDTFWLERLYGDRPMPFKLDHLSSIEPSAFMAAKQAAVPRHRALPDAVWLWHTVRALRHD